MALELRDCLFTGPAFPEPFVQLELDKELGRRGLLPRTTGEEGRRLQESWDAYRRKLRELVLQGGSIRVRNHVIEPLIARLGYARLDQANDVQTREGSESGGCLLVAGDGEPRLRTWSVDLGIDLDAPAKRGAAYRYSYVRIAQRVLLASGERIGLITNGVELRILISDPARPDSQIEIPIDPGWKRSRDVPDSYRLLLALASPAGVAALPELVEKARLQQTRVTKELRVQARRAVEHFVQEILDNPANEDHLAPFTDRQQLARQLWREGLITVYRLLFILKLESTDDPARSFSFASTSLWRNSFSPTTRLAGVVRDVLDGRETGQFLEQGLRSLFRMFTEGLQCTELKVQPLGGALFGEQATPILSHLHWSERAVAYLLDQLLWTPRRRGSDARERVHYGPLDVEDLGRVYEALLELEPGITTEPMCRLRRAKLEVVVPVAQGDRYRPATEPDAQARATGTEPGARATGQPDDEVDDQDEETEEEEADDESGNRRGGTRVEWIEAIPPNRFYLRVGLGRKATGSYYTPHSFVRFLVQETLGPQVAERSPQNDPKPLEILKLKVLDPAMGSGHFLVEACRFLGEKLYEACRLCDEKALKAEHRAEQAKRKEDREALLAEAARFRQRVMDLPDPNDELVKYLPSRAPEGEESGLSQRKAQALCRRMVAVHCLYGVDKNPLAVELAKLSLWIESHAEGLPLTFLDHRLVVGDSLTGPFWDTLKSNPGNGAPVADLFRQQVDIAFGRSLGQAIDNVRHLDATVGATIAELADKQRLKAELDQALRPFVVVAAAWSGGVMIGLPDCDDAAYGDLVRVVAQTGELPDRIESARLRGMIARGLAIDELPESRDAVYAVLESGRCIPAHAYDLAFPEVFYPTGVPFGRQGFDAVLTNPPWDRMLPADKEFFASYEFAILNAPTRRERSAIQNRLLTDASIRSRYENYIEGFRGAERVVDRLYRYQVVEVNGERTIGKQDLFRLFMERDAQLLGSSGRTGIVVPSAFHANEGATGIRRLYLEQMAMACCYSFENRRLLFEIHRSFKFAVAVAARQGPTGEFACAFYLHDDEWLFGGRGDRELRYDLEFVRRTGGAYLSFVEPRTTWDLAAARVCFASGRTFEDQCRPLNVELGRELNSSDDSYRFVPTDQLVHHDEDPRDPEVCERFIRQGILLLHEGRTFHQFTDHWEERNRYCVPASNLLDRPEILRNSRFYRLSYRKISASTNERTCIFALLPPGATGVDYSPSEQRPNERRLAAALLILAVCNTYPADFCLRLYVSSATVNYFFLARTPFPHTLPASMLARTGLRLTCNHAGYGPLWREQLGDAWREDKPPFTWPVLAGDDERWAARAAIDAVVADAYGLSRGQYEHVLGTFSHASYPRAPELCLARFDELRAIGLEAFTRRYDPYWDIPLNENLPQPVIDLPIPQEPADAAEPMLWQERDGQLTTIPPGPLFDQGSGVRASGSGEDGHPHPGREGGSRRGRRPRATAAAASQLDETAYNELLAYLRNQRTITSGDAQQLLGLTASEVRPLLQRLVEERYAAMEGRGRGRLYRLSSIRET